MGEHIIYCHSRNLPHVNAVYLCQALLRKCTSKSQADVLFSACQKLVAPDDMGSRFKFMALCAKGGSVPIGFA